LPSGQTIFVSVLVKAKADATTSVSIANATVLGVTGEDLKVTIDPSSLTAPAAKAIALDPTLIIPLAVLLVLVVGAVLLARSGRIPVRIRRRWPFYVSLALGLVPVALFFGIVLTLLYNSAPVLTLPGIPALFGADYINAQGQTAQSQF